MTAGERVETLWPPLLPSRTRSGSSVVMGLCGVVVVGFCPRLVAVLLGGGTRVVVGAVVVGRCVVVIAVVVLVELNTRDRRSSGNNGLGMGSSGSIEETHLG